MATHGPTGPEITGTGAFKTRGASVVIDVTHARSLKIRKLRLAKDVARSIGVIIFTSTACLLSLAGSGIRDNGASATVAAVFDDTIC